MKASVGPAVSRNADGHGRFTGVDARRELSAARSGKRCDATSTTSGQRKPASFRQGLDQVSSRRRQGERPSFTRVHRTHRGGPPGLDGTGGAVDSRVENGPKEVQEAVRRGIRGSGCFTCHRPAAAVRTAGASDPGFAPPGPTWRPDFRQTELRSTGRPRSGFFQSHRPSNAWRRAPTVLPEQRPKFVSCDRRVQASARSRGPG
jgi:hypothetical protein